jgi:hypothetical protein
MHGMLPPCVDGFVSQAEAGELLHVGLEELQLLLERVEAVALERQALGKEKAYWMGSRMSGTPSCAFTPPSKLHATVDDGLRMDEHLDIGRRVRRTAIWPPSPRSLCS